MANIKTYSEFLNESKETNIVNVILHTLEPTITQMLSQIETWFIKTFEQEFTKYDRENARLNLIFDMVKAIENYTLSNDSLVSINVSKSAKGNIQIDAQIQRDGTTYTFSTEAIYAGGHNIQRLHYRYIVKTNLPKTGVKTITNEYADKIKKMSRLEKINKEIRQSEARIKKTAEEAEVNSRLSDTEIIQAIKDNPNESWYEWPTWDEIVKRDAAKNYNNDEAFYNSERENGIARKIESWKRMNIEWKLKYVENWKKELQKLITKRDSMV